jgi:quinohemoprotein amine dehydrogenase
MVTLNGVKLEPAAARAIVKYLANQQGLAPAELRPGSFEVERRTVDYRYTADTKTEETCRGCHSLGRVITQRRTSDEWELLVATHRAYYPISDFQAFRRTAPPNPDSAPAPHPMDVATAHLAKAFPLRTAEWAAWSATMRPPPLDGAWLLSGYEPGRGPFYGRVSITRVPENDDEFTTHATYRYAGGGAGAARDGRAVVYTGYQWRGRSAAPGDTDSRREVMLVEPGWQQMSGRWFKGGYDELGMDVSLTRIGANPAVVGVVPRALRTGASEQELTIFGANLPRDVAPAALDFGPGVRATSVTRATSDEIVVRVRVDSAASVGARDLFLGGAALRGAVVVYDKISRIKVTPQAGMARVGGIRFPKQFQQYEAIAFANGPDGRPETADDVEIGPVPVTWSLEEYAVTFDDDDIKFVGSVDQHGLFTPNVDGPNPQRSGNRDNIGDVWVVATYRPAQPGARPIKARGHVLVTVPLYMRWEPWRAEQ